MTYRLILQPQAQADLEQIQAHLLEHSPLGAARWFDAWFDACERLKTEAPESSSHQIAIRQILFRTRRGKYYRAVFVILDQVVHVLSIRGHGQDLIAPGEFSFPEDKTK